MSERDEAVEKIVEDVMDAWARSIPGAPSVESLIRRAVEAGRNLGLRHAGTLLDLEAERHRQATPDDDDEDHQLEAYSEEYARQCFEDLAGQLRALAGQEGRREDNA